MMAEEIHVNHPEQNLETNRRFTQESRLMPYLLAVLEILQQTNKPFEDQGIVVADTALCLQILDTAN